MPGFGFIPLGGAAGVYAGRRVPKGSQRQEDRYRDLFFRRRRGAEGVQRVQDAMGQDTGQQGAGTAKDGHEQKSEGSGIADLRPFLRSHPSRISERTVKSGNVALFSMLNDADRRSAALAPATYAAIQNREKQS